MTKQSRRFPFASDETAHIAICMRRPPQLCRALPSNFIADGEMPADIVINTGEMLFPSPSSPDTCTRGVSLVVVFALRNACFSFRSYRQQRR